LGAQACGRRPQKTGDAMKIYTMDDERWQTEGVVVFGSVSTARKCFVEWFGQSNRLDGKPENNGIEEFCNALSVYEVRRSPKYDHDGSAFFGNHAHFEEYLQKFQINR